MLQLPVLATPLPAESAPEFVQVIAVPPSAKVTVPVGAVRPVVPVTVAVKVNAVPKGDEAFPVVSATVTVGVFFVIVTWVLCEGPIPR